MSEKKKIWLHKKTHKHLTKHFHKHVQKMLHVTNFMHHNLFHTLELTLVCLVTITSLSFASLSGLNQDLYTHNETDTAQRLLSAMQNPTKSLKLWNLISIWNMDMDIENSFAKWYCTYGAARISPEFFPFSGEKTQQRTWWGNAVDRCKNAADTWYKIWSVPSQWALVVYDAGGKFWSYGHVGKVLHHEKALKKIIVRDMARVARGTMSDRREDLSTANIKCYIYNSKTTIPTDTIIPIDQVPPIISWKIPVDTPPTIPPNPMIPSNPVILPQPTLPTPRPTLPTHPAPPIVPALPQESTDIIPPIVVVPPPISENISSNQINKTIPLEVEKLRDIAQHFITQNDLSLTLSSLSPRKFGETAKLTLEIKNKKTGNPYSGLLPFSLTILSSNDAIQPNISRIQMVNNWSVDILLLAQKMGSATIVVSIDDKKIGEFGL